MTPSAPAPSAGELEPRQSKFARARRLALELGVVGLGYALLTRCQTGDLLDNGDVAPDFTTLDLDGNAVTLSNYATSPVLLHFWATWCGVCRQEFGALNALHEELSAATAAIPAPRLFTLAADDDPGVLKAFAEQFKLRFPILIAPASLLATYKIKAFPTSYYLGANRLITATTVGMSSRWAMKARLGCAKR